MVQRPGWQQHSEKEHAFTSPQGAAIDLLPAGPTLIAAGEITWASGTVMSLAAMDLAFAHAQPHAVAHERTILVAPPPVVGVLKMVSYSDRPADRERDLADIAHLLAGYVDDDSDRRFDDAQGFEFELAPGYLFGVDVGRVTTTASHRAVVGRFLATVSDPDTLEHARMQQLGPAHWRSDDSLTRCLDAFKAGLAASPA